MSRTIVIVFMLSIVISIGLGVYLYVQNPGGMLLYTPAPGVKGHYTSSSNIGFFIGTLLLSAGALTISLALALCSAVCNKEWWPHSKQAFFLFIGFGILNVIANYTERVWP